MVKVGIWGATGFMGAPFTRALLKAHRSSSSSSSSALHLTVLHRPESDLTRYPRDVELRCIDLHPSIPIASVSRNLEDLEVVVSCTSFRAGDAQYRLIDALKGSANLVTLFVSEYATPHREEDLSGGMLAHSVEKEKVAKYCEAQGVPFTRLYNGTVPKLLFWMPSFSSFKVAENKLTLYWPLGEGKRALTSEEFSGRAIVHLLLKRLHELPNRSFSLVEISFSAQELIALFKKLHNGQDPTIVKYTEEDYQRDLHKDFMAAMGAAGKKGLAVGTEWPGEVVSSFPGWTPKTLEEYVRPCLMGNPMTLEDVRAGQDLSKA